MTWWLELKHWPRTRLYNRQNRPWDVIIMWCLRPQESIVTTYPLRSYDQVSFCLNDCRWGGTETQCCSSQTNSDWWNSSESATLWSLGKSTKATLATIHAVRRTHWVARELSSKFQVRAHLSIYRQDAIVCECVCIFCKGSPGCLTHARYNGSPGVFTHVGQMVITSAFCLMLLFVVCYWIWTPSIINEL